MGGICLHVGCHVSIREGYLGAAKLSKRVGGNAYQYFPKNPRSLSIKEVNKHDVEACTEFCKQHNMVSVAHTPYPTNLTAEGIKREETIRSLLNDLHIAQSCGSIGVVVHFGSDINPEDPLAGYQAMIHTLDEILEKWDGDCLLLIENNAGKPGSMGTTLEEQIQIRNLCAYPEKIGFCLDTCHAFASGLWNGENTEAFVEKGNQLGYFDHLKVVHLNNSKYGSGLGKDRHEHIKTGKIEVKHIVNLLSLQPFNKVPFVLETPNHPSGDHKDEIIFVKKLFHRLRH
jgi:deoxyribonuclease IV